MTFFSGPGTSECGAVNPMTGLFKQFGQDRSLQHDRYNFEKLGDSSKAGLRTQNHNNSPIHETQLADEFFRNELRRTEANMFQFKGLHNELSLIDHQQQQQQTTNWATDFGQFQEFEKIFEKRQKMIQGTNYWSQEFEQFQSSHTSPIFNQTEAFEQAFERIKQYTPEAVNWEKEFTQASTRSEFQEQSSITQTHNENESSFMHARPTMHVNHRESPYTLEDAFTFEHIEHAREQPDYRTSYNNYTFQTHNPHLREHQVTDHDSLADTILDLEAKALNEPTDADTWKQLGLCQQENERDDAAISALRQAVEINPNLLDAWLALSVSFTNKHCRADAYDSLEQWISHNDHYKHLLHTIAPSKDRHAYITQLFLDAARSLPGENMDADVQVALGILFTISEEYAKAVDCFRSALSSRPEDYLLWNKLGASLANSGDANGAIDAYFQALEIKPTFVRARYNLAITCIGLGQRREAAEHLLGALAIREDGVVPEGMSDNVWGTLRMIMLNIGRDDLAVQCDDQNLDAFRTEFEF